MFKKIFKSLQKKQTAPKATNSNPVKVATITTEKFAAFAPKANPAIASALAAAADEFGIHTPRQVRHWLAHLYVESSGFTRLTENLNYSATRLTQVWPSRFPNLNAARPFASNPQALANKVYGGRLGNTGANDGYLYRGRGFIQITGKANYAYASKALNLDLVANPDAAANIQVAARIAGWYWRARNINAIVAREPDEVVLQDVKKQVILYEEDDLRQGTKTINGGLNGLDHRREALLRAAQIWKD